MSEYSKLNDNAEEYIARRFIWAWSFSLNIDKERNGAGELMLDDVAVVAMNRVCDDAVAASQKVTRRQLLISACCFVLIWIFVPFIFQWKDPVWLQFVFIGLCAFLALLSFAFLLTIACVRRPAFLKSFRDGVVRENALLSERGLRLEFSSSTTPQEIVTSKGVRQAQRWRLDVCKNTRNNAALIHCYISTLSVL